MFHNRFLGLTSKDILVFVPSGFSLLRADRSKMHRLARHCMYDPYFKSCILLFCMTSIVSFYDSLGTIGMLVFVSSESDRTYLKHYEVDK